MNQERIPKKKPAPVSGKAVPKKGPPRKKPAPGKGPAKTPPPPKKLSNRTWKGLLIGGILFLAVIAAGSSLYFHLEGSEAEEVKTEVAPDPVPEDIRKMVDAGNIKDALDAVKMVMDQRPDDLPLRIEVMRLDLMAERYADAVKLADIILETDPENALAYAVKGVGFYQSAKFEDAIKLSLKSIQMDGGQALPYRTLGDVYIRQGKYDDAITILKQAVRLDGKNAEGWTKLSGAYIKKQDYKRAQLAAEAGIEANPDYAGAHFNLAHIYFRKKDGPKALNHIQKAEDLYRAQENVPWVAKARQNKNMYIKHFKMRPEDISK